MLPVVGERAMDVVFSFNFANDDFFDENFNLAEFCGKKNTIRISNMASPEMILQKLKNVFGDQEEFNIEIARAMKVC